MKKASIAFICIILAMCVLPVALMLCGVKNANRENRPLAQTPKLVSEGSLNLKFPAGFDKYLNDHFALRERLVDACNTASVKLLGDYNGQSAIIGREGTLYYSETAGDYLGVDLMTEEQIASAADLLAALKQELAEQGRALIFVAAPNKASIYPEYMPGYLKPAGGESNLSRLQAALEERGVDYIDAESILTAAKSAYDRPVYYLRDSHWNNLGSTLIYNALASKLGLEEYDPKAFSTTVDYNGDLVNFVYPASDHYEERLVYTYPRGYETVDHMVNFDMFKVNETKSEANDLCLLIYHDSFGKSLQPIFSTAVGRLIMQKSNSPSYSAEDAAQYGADAVVIELVERNLDLLADYAASKGF